MADKKKSGIEHPAPPAATRLNKLAVIVAAGVMSVTLLVVTLMIGRTSEQEVEEKAQREEESRLRRGAARPGFMDRPPQMVPAEDPLANQVAEKDPFAPGPEPGGNPYEGFGDPELSTSYVPPELYEPAPYYETPAPAASQASQKSPEEQALERALRASLTPQGFGGSASSPNSQGLEEDEAASDPDFLSTLAEVQQALGVASGGTATPIGEATRPGSPTASGGAAARPRPAPQGSAAGDALSLAVIEQPASRLAVREGTLVEAFLITGIHSDLPGEVVAQVSRNVYDSGMQQVLLIPKGTRLVGSYDNQIALDQSRLLVAWTRLIFPDGRSLRLPGLSSKDTRGATGLTGRVNRHFFRAFGNALMLSVVGSGLALAQRRPDAGAAAYPTPGEIMAGSVATELSRVATEILRSSVSRRPTITIREGTAFGVFISGDIALPPYRPQDGFMQ